MNVFIEFIEHISSVAHWKEVSDRCLAALSGGESVSLSTFYNIPRGPLNIHEWLHEEVHISRNIGGAAGDGAQTAYDIQVAKECARYASVKSVKNAADTFSFINIRALLYASTRTSRFVSILQKMVEFSDVNISLSLQAAAQPFFDIYTAWKPHVSKCKRHKDMMLRMLTISVASCVGAFKTDISLAGPSCTCSIVAQIKDERHVIIERADDNKRELYFGEEVSYPQTSFHTKESVAFLADRCALLAYLWSAMVDASYRHRMWVDSGSRIFYFLSPIFDGRDAVVPIETDILYYFWRYVMGMSCPGSVVLQRYGIAKGVHQPYLSATYTRGPCASEYITQAKICPGVRDKIGSWGAILDGLRADCLEKPSALSVQEIDGIIIAIRYIEALINPYN